MKIKGELLVFLMAAALLESFDICLQYP